ncbi:superoxide dismutase [Nocardia sp. NRRL S-836]|uniref:superoxide dismutase n=1 Tax=Nocardia sp. NRRL S-836 TaxID=1519492 RepID=UPI000B19A5BB|nr:superoxide dismutase [Nocardia sp. NRRL S-836]
MTARRTLTLPDGFRPESLAIGAEPIAYFGSLADGTIHSVDLLDGTGRTISPGRGEQAGGLQLDSRGRLFVSGCFNGDARVVDARTGELLARYRLARTHPSVVADVILTEDSAWFTDSFNPVLYRLPIGADGELPAEDAVETLELSGDLVYSEGFNICGITTTPDGSGLLVVQASTGQLFRVDPASGVATVVDLAGSGLPSGDGMLRVGSTLYVTLGLGNTMAVVRLDARGGKGVVVERISLHEFDVPTAVAAYSDNLVVVNSRITTEPTPTTAYTAVVFQRE